VEELIVWAINAAVALAVALACMCIPLGIIYLILSS
jgi:hypothetical protein